MKLLILAVLAIISTPVVAQHVSLTGTTVDANGDALPFTTLTSASPGVQSVISDAAGSFTLTLQDSATNVMFVVTQVGYVTDTVRVSRSTNNIIVTLTEAKITLEEVVVTGSSKATSIRENPLAIALISARTIERTPESNIIESLARHVAGLNTVTTGPNISKPFIRGLGYNRVLTMYDGMRQEGQQWGDEHGIEVDNYNLEKAEVIKGPASLLYGSDALAGVVSFFPVMPKLRDGSLHGNLLTEYQGNNGLWGNGIRLVFADRRWFLSVSASHRNARNYSNKIDGDVYNTGFAEKNFTAMIGRTLARGESRFAFTYYDDLQGIPDGSRDSLSRAFTRQDKEGAEDDVRSRPVVTEGELASYRLAALHQHIRHYRLYTANKFEIGRGDVNVLFGLQQNIRQEYNHPTAPDQAGLNVRLNTINYGIRYNAPEFSGVGVAFGVNGMVQQNRNKDATDFPIPDYSLRDAGGYAFVQWKTQRFNTTGGIRYDVRYISGRDFYIRPATGSQFQRQATLPDTAGAHLQFPKLTQHFTGISVGLGTAYELSEVLSLKLNIGRGYRAPNISEIASNGLDPGAHIVYIGNRNFVPEFSFQQDLGITAEFKNISASLSIFNNAINNYIYLSQVADPQESVHGNKTFRYLQSSARLYGIEASVAVHPQAMRGFQFTSNVSAVAGRNTNADFSNKGNLGENLPFIPPLKVLSSVRQEIKTKSFTLPVLTLGTDLDLIAAQRRYLALYNTETPTAGYALVNFSVSADIKYFASNLISVQLQVNNAFDNAYQSNLSRLKYFEYYTASPNGKLGMYGMGRNFCVRITVKR